MVNTAAAGVFAILDSDRVQIYEDAHRAAAHDADMPRATVPGRANDNDIHERAGDHPREPCRGNDHGIESRGAPTRSTEESRHERARRERILGPRRKRLHREHDPVDRNNKHTVIAPPIDVPCAEGVAPGRATIVSVGGLAVAVFNVDGRLYAIDDGCLRCGASLAHGTSCGHEVTCTQCGWRYDVVTGGVSALPALRLDRFRASVADGRIVVDECPLP